MFHKLKTRVLEGGNDLNVERIIFFEYFLKIKKDFNSASQSQILDGVRAG